MIRHHWRLRSVSRRVSEVWPEPAPECALTGRIESLEYEISGMGSVQFFVIAVILWLAVAR